MGKRITIEFDPDDLSAVEDLARDMNAADPGANWEIAEMVKDIVLSVVVTHAVLCRDKAQLH